MIKNGSLYPKKEVVSYILASIILIFIYTSGASIVFFFSF